MVQVQIAAKYLSGQSATWGEGDWDRAPGGAPGNPPLGDGIFNQLDIIVALASGVYLTGPYAAVQPSGQSSESRASIGYDPTTGEVFVDAPADTELTSINIDSAAGIFTGEAAQNLGGRFDNDADGNIFKATFGGSFGSISFGNVARKALSIDFLLNDLKIVASVEGGGNLGAVDLIYVPEPSSVLLVALGLALLILLLERDKGFEIIRNHRKYVAVTFAIMTVAYATGTCKARADYAAAVLADDPVGYWRFNDPDGSDTAVNSGSGGADLNGTYVDVDRSSSGPDQVGGQPIVGLGTDNKAISLGPDISYVSTEASPLNNLEEFTMSGWVSADERLNARIGLWGQNDASEFGFINPTRIQMWTPGGGYLNYDLLEGGTIDNGEWFHIATVGDGEQILLYINGVNVTESSMFRGSATFDYGASDFTFSIGGGGVFDPPGGSGLSDDGNQFTGTIDEVAIWDVALSQERIQAHFNAAFVPAGGPSLQAGDADQDLKFDQLDLVHVQIAAKYLTGNAATWGEGDWDGAPGGSVGNPPPGDATFNQLDIIAALSTNSYLNGPYAAIQPDRREREGQTSVIYDPNTGELAVDAPAGVELTSIDIDSAAGIFTENPAQNLGGSFDNDADGNIFKATFGGSFGSLSFGNVAQDGRSESSLMGELSVARSLAGGGDLGAVDPVYVPEPTSVLLLSVGFAIGLLRFRRRIN